MPWHSCLRVLNLTDCVAVSRISACAVLEEFKCEHLRTDDDIFLSRCMQLKTATLRRIYIEVVNPDDYKYFDFSRHSKLKRLGCEDLHFLHTVTVSDSLDN